jgi:glycosyltransferase involved in cell wall biosynthesis
VKNWAWWNKSLYLKKHLSNDFNFELVYIVGKDKTTYINASKYDIFFTYGWTYIDMLNSIPKERKITGMTAHRTKKVVEPRMQKAVAVHANSMMLYNELKTIHDNVFYVPNGVDEELFRVEKQISKYKKSLVVGHVGKNCPVKGQQVYIIPAIKKSRAKSHLHLKDYRDMIPYEDMWKTYQNMDCFIVASTEDGTPNPALEAAACGRPIISNRIGNMPEFIKDGWNGFIIDERNVEQYTEKIKYFKNDRKELIRMGENARMTVELAWTWKQQAENYRLMFKTVLKML